MPMTIDLTPTWAGLVGIGMHILERSLSEEKTRDPDSYDEEGWERERVGLDEAKDVWREEFAKMAKAADNYNKMVKERNITTAQDANNECTDLAARLDEASTNESLPQEERDALDQAKWAVEEAMEHTDPDTV